LTSKRILVFRIGSLGDTIVAIPAFWRIRQAFPHAHITFLSNSDNSTLGYIQPRSILPESGLFDEWLTYPTGGLIGFAKLFYDIRRNKYDELIYLMPRTRTVGQLKRDQFFFRASGIKVLKGIDYLFTNRLELNAKYSLPEVDREGDFIWDCLTADGIPLADAERSFDLRLTQQEVAFAENWLNSQIPDIEKKPIVAVAPGSKWNSKKWGEDKYFETVSHLIKGKDIFPIVFGGPEDKTLGDRLIARWGRGANAAGQLNVRQAAAALIDCDLYLGNDTGTMHIAAAAGCRCVAIFASIDWNGRWFPAGNGHTSFRTRIECEGCHLTDCPIGNECLSRISVEQVVWASTEALSKHGAAN